jgi:hypothetical protein
MKKSNKKIPLTAVRGVSSMTVIKLFKQRTWINPDYKKVHEMVRLLKSVDA